MFRAEGGDGAKTETKNVIILTAVKTSNITTYICS
jgi:hypothetical protein